MEKSRLEVSGECLVRKSFFASTQFSGQDRRPHYDYHAVTIAGSQGYFWSYGENAFLEADESDSAMFATCRAQIR